MLKFIRRNAEAAWVKIMFVIIVVVFVFWGIGSVVGGQKAQIVARVNGEVIDPVDFTRTYNGLVRMYEDLYKGNFQSEMLKSLNLKGQAMDQLIHGALLRQEAQRIGLRVTEAELRDSVAQMPAFQRNGRFNRNVYLNTLRANGMTAGEFEEAQRNELLGRKLQELIAAGIHVSEQEVRDRFRLDNERINLQFIKIEPSTFMPEVHLSDEDVQTYFDKHKDEFREPDRVRIAYVEYAPEAFADRVEINDSVLKQYYESHLPAYMKPEQVHARHILFRVPPDASPEVKAEIRKRAEEVLQKVKAGEDFAALAKQYSEDDATAAEGGDLGFFGRGKLVPPVEQAAWALQPGQTSEIVESPSGFHIIKLEAREEARTQSLDEVREQVTQSVKSEKSRDLARTAAGDAQTKASAGAPLTTLAQAAGLTVITTAPFAEHDAIPGVTGTGLSSAAFSVDVNAIGPVVDTPQGFYVFRVTEKIPAHVPALADIRERVEGALRTERAEALAKSRAEALLPEAQKSGLEAVAAANGLTLDDTGPFTRDGTYIPNIGSVAALKKEAFKLTSEKPVAPAVYSVLGSSFVVALKERLPADDAEFETKKDALMRQAEQQRDRQVQEAFLNYLKARATVDISQDYLASIPDTARTLDSRRFR